jgi:hypothetical protein
MGSLTRQGADIEWVVNDDVYWSIHSDRSARPATLYRINPGEVLSTRLAYVNQNKRGTYESLIHRANYGVWTLGEFTDLQEAKNTILAALTIQRLENN